MITKRYITDLTYLVIGCCIEVHRHLGPGLLESVYQKCLIEELQTKEILVQSQLHVPIRYKEKDLGGMLKLDLVVNNVLILELKAVEQMIPLYKAQLLSYMKLTGIPKGLLINFNCENIKNQMATLVSENYSKLPYD
jgi:GxxExxY protein